MAGLENLSWITGLLSIMSNKVLENLDGLSGLKHLGFDIYRIAGNPALTSIKGLHNLEYMGGIFVEIDENQSLYDCRVEAFIDHLHSIGWNGYTATSGNAPDPDGGCEDE
jgi:hypothetical protein